LKADASKEGEGWSDSQVAEALDTSIDTVARTRQQLVEEGFEAVLVRKHSPASARRRIFDGAAEAKLIALACSEPPNKGRKRWTLQLLEEQVVELKIVDRASDNTIGRTLKNILKPHLQKQWVIPPDANAAFVAGMEDVLEVYQRPHDPEYPLVCLDETAKQLIAETRVPIPATPGQLARNGTANLFMMFAPLERWRHVEVTDRHRRRLRQGPQGLIRHALPESEEDHARARQPQHPQTGFTL
jgi:transposase